MASVLATLKDRAPTVKCRVEEYLAMVVPGVHAVDPKAVGPRAMLEFKQDVRGAPHPWRFLATNMSDGTLRTLGVLVALFQAPAGLVAIEEPEVALYPAAAGVLTDPQATELGLKQLSILGTPLSFTTVTSKPQP